MRRRTVGLAGLVAIGACAGTQLLLDKGPDTATLIVEIRGIAHEGGQLRCALFGAPEGFPDDPDAAERVERLEISGGSAEWRIENLPTGMWAVSVLHDENADGTMGTDWMGRPSEGWGVSRDARGRFGPPAFEDAAIELGPGEQSIVVHLAY
jgi:uncharacterized protein (DUF2141 family)